MTQSQIEGSVRVDGILCDISLDPLIVPAFRVAFEGSADIPHLGCRPPRSADHLADPAHRLRVGRDHRYRTCILQDIFSCDCLGPDARVCECNIFRNRLVEVMAYHQHLSRQLQ